MPHSKTIFRARSPLRGWNFPPWSLPVLLASARTPSWSSSLPPDGPKIVADGVNGCLSLDVWPFDEWGLVSGCNLPPAQCQLGWALARGDPAQVQRLQTAD